MTDITENRRRTLAALRAPMPEGFEWDFTEAYKAKEPKGCGAVGCAMGLMRAIGIVELALIDPCADALDISDSDACAVFAPGRNNNLTQTYPGLRYEDVTVADALERAFAEHPVGEGE